MKACRLCQKIYDDEKVCSTCGVDLADKFSGMVIILDSQKSQIAPLIGKTSEGKFAIKI